MARLSRSKSQKNAKAQPASRRAAKPAKRLVKRAPVRAARRTPTFLKPRAKAKAPPLQAALQAPRPRHSAEPEPRETARGTTWQAPSASPFSIPTGYGDHRIVLMVKDPWWLYAYWELQPEQERQARRQLSPEEAAGLRMALRVYDVTGRRYPDEPANRWFDQTVSELARNWFLHANAPDRSFIVEIGLLTQGGRFLMLARSNRVTTPRFGPSDVLDQEWMISDEAYWKLFSMTAGVGVGSSAGLKDVLDRQLSSPGAWSPLLGPAPKAAPNT